MNNFYNYNNTTYPLNVNEIYPQLPGPSDVSPLNTFSNSCVSDPVIDSWLIKNGKYPSVLPVAPKPPKKITISAAKSSLKLCESILKKLTLTCNDMFANVDKMSPSDWKKKLVKIGNHKEKLNAILNNFNNPETISSLKTSIKNRKRKRLNNKKRAKQRTEKKVEAKRKNQELNKEIDRWLKAMEEENNKIKTEENMTKDIDVVLHEVNKKKQDARKHISLLTSLIKLRNARENIKCSRGEKSSAEDKKSFMITTQKMLEMWENALKNYKTEEHMLKTMLEKNATDNMKHKELLKIKSITSSWEQVIFGEKAVIPSENITYWALTAAERDFETFIAIRKSWDTFLVSGDTDLGSKIPIGWVLPPSDLKDSWAQYLAP